MNKEYTTEECLQEYYNSLEKQLKEKDKMIDWLASVIHTIDNRPGKPTPKEYWIKSAQEAVKNE